MIVALSKLRQPIACAIFIVASLSICQPTNAADNPHLETISKFVENHCLDCHNSDDTTAGLDLEKLNLKPSLHDQPWDTTDWEKVVKRLQAGQMPPADSDRPTEDQYKKAIGAFTAVLDESARRFPAPGQTDAVSRLNRTEYRNAIRDLLTIDVDAESLLPSDQSGHGFDNVTLGGLSPALLNRYITAAEKISRTAIGRKPTKAGKARSPEGRTVRLPADRTQESHVEGLPLGTRGGTLVKHYFSVDGEYEVQIRLMRDRDENIEGLTATHDIDILLDRKRVHRFTVESPKKVGKWAKDDTLVDANLKTRFQVTAGPHTVGVTFPKNSASLAEIKRQPFQPSFNRHRHPRKNPALFEVSIVGPLSSDTEKDTGKETADDSIEANEPDKVAATTETPSRRKVLVHQPQDPTNADEAKSCAEKNLQRLVRLAYRRPITEQDLATPMHFFEDAFNRDGFEAGMESALAAVLVNPHFLMRAQSPPADAKTGSAYQVSDIELASRLSFFLWSSLPDDELLDLAESNRLHEPEILRQQVLRLLKDERSRSLVDNFAAQWLYLRNLASFQPDRRLFPDFDDNLRIALRRETELFFADVVSEDRSVLDLIQSDTTFLNERLAQHYDIPHVRGSHFRQVKLNGDEHRGGLLRHGSILAVTSYATRTSPTVRGNWILKNMLGIPAPPPPPDIPSLPEKTKKETSNIRERLAEHRANPACASCHNLTDPVGFALENFDAVGRWRIFDQGVAVDSNGSLPDGTPVASLEQLESGILERPEMFVGTLTEKLLTFALGRGIEPSDGPAIRKVVRESADNNYSFSSLITSIVSSTPFKMRTAP